MIANRRSAEIMMVEKSASAKTQISGTISVLAHFGTLHAAGEDTRVNIHGMLPMFEPLVSSGLTGG